MMFIFVFENDEPINVMGSVDGRVICHETQPTYVINANTIEEAIEKLIPIRTNGSDDPEDYMDDINDGNILVLASSLLIK